MNAAKKDLPPPDVGGTDPDQTLRQRFSIGGPPATPPEPVQAHTPVQAGTGVYGQSQNGRKAPKGRTRGRSRPDAEGMRRVSYYVSEQAAQAMDHAVDQVMEALGGDVPKHVALSALITAGADRVKEVAAGLAEQRAAELTRRLEAVRKLSPQATE